MNHIYIPTTTAEDWWFDEYARFLALFGAPASAPGKLFFLKETCGVKLYSGWARGDARFLQM